MSTEVQNQIQLPLGKAVELSWKNLKVRWWRSMLVTSGIILALAFMTYILCSEAIASGSQAAADVVDEAARTQTLWLVSLALLISFVGILNAMLMSVTERFGEIGTMKCLGALDGFIIKLFLLESAFQGMVGTAIGMVIGLILAFIEGMIGHGFGVFSVVPGLALLKIVGFCLAIGTFLTVAGALYPAWQAARMKPVDAMRWEG